MNILQTLRARFQTPLADWVSDSAALAELLDMVRPSGDPKFGDYQANLAMPLAKRLGKPPRDLAAEIASRAKLDDLCQHVEVAGPGFINLKLRDDWITAQLEAALRDADRLGIAAAAHARTYVIDYSGPNVAKPMHVGHIRSTVIGDALYRVLKFLGHRVIGDNHLGDWGTQFGMILYGWKHFRDDAAYARSAVDELARLYRLTRQLVDYHKAVAAVPERESSLAQQRSQLEQRSTAMVNPDKAAAKKEAAALQKLKRGIEEAAEELAGLKKKITAVESDPALLTLARQHASIGDAVLAETAQLHAGDAENLRLWKEFLPACRADIEAIYDRLGVTFDHTLGESFYHDRLAAVVADLTGRGLVRESEGARCLFLEGFDHPMIVQKRDGAFLYSTSDLATIQYRLETWRPDAILYVVDHRQAGHFGPLFAAARLWGVRDVELVHVAFGTVMGSDGRPFKTREGDTVGLQGLLDEAENRALAIVSENDDAKPAPELSPDERRRVAAIVGIGAIKYADLAHNRTSDYEFSYDKMLATRGNTATYMQYAYARIRSIFRKGDIDPAAIAQSARVQLDQPCERALALGLLGFEEALAASITDYRPNQLTAYLFDLATRYSTFYQECDVLKADSPATRDSRLALCDLTSRTLKLGLSLLGIQVIEKM